MLLVTPRRRCTALRCAGAAGSSSGVLPLRRDFASNGEDNSSRTSGTTLCTLLCRDLASPFDANSQQSARPAVVAVLRCALVSHAALERRRPLPPQCRGKRRRRGGAPSTPPRLRRSAADRARHCARWGHETL